MAVAVYSGGVLGVAVWWRCSCGGGGGGGGGVGDGGGV